MQAREKPNTLTTTSGLSPLCTRCTARTRIASKVLLSSFLASCLFTQTLLHQALFNVILTYELINKLKGFKIDTCPFSNLPEKKRTQWALTKEEMKNCVWLEPSWSPRSSLPNGHQMVTCGIQSLSG